MDDRGGLKQDMIRWTPQDPVTARSVIDAAIAAGKLLPPANRYKVIHRGRVIEAITLRLLAENNMFFIRPKTVEEARAEAPLRSATVDIQAKIYDPVAKVTRERTLEVPNQGTITALDIVNAAVREGYLNDNINKIVIMDGHVLQAVPLSELVRSGSVTIRPGDVMRALEGGPSIVRTTGQRDAHVGIVQTLMHDWEVHARDFKQRVDAFFRGASTNVEGVERAADQLVEATLHNVGEIVRHVKAVGGGGVAVGGAKRAARRRRSHTRSRTRSGTRSTSRRGR